MENNKEKNIYEYELSSSSEDKKGRGKHHRFKRHLRDDNEEQLNDVILQRLLRKSGHFMAHRSRHGESRFYILALLEKNEGINQKELAELLDIKSGSLSEILSKMEAKGFISRIQDEEDRRNMKVQLSESGKEILSEMRAKKEEEREKMFSSLSEEEKEQMIQSLEKLVNSWKESIKEDGEGKYRHGHHGDKERRKHHHKHYKDGEGRKYHYQNEE